MKELTMETVKKQFCTDDMLNTLKEIRKQLDETMTMDETAELMCAIGADMEEQLSKEGETFAPIDRILWTVKEAFILGSLNMAKTMLDANAAAYNDLAGGEPGQ